MSERRHFGLALLLAGVLAGCAAPQGDLLVSVSPDAPGSSPSPLAKVPRAIVSVAPFGEVQGQADPAVVGDRLDSDSRKVGAIRVQPAPGRLLQQAVAAELRAAGHQVGGAESPVAVDGAVQRFAVTAAKAGLYWQVTVDLAAGVTAQASGRHLSHSYVARCQDVAYVIPSAEMLAPLIGRCVADLGRQFRDDADMARAIGG